MTKKFNILLSVFIATLIIYSSPVLPISRVLSQVAVPATPTNLDLTVASQTQINLDWIDNATNETGYRFERKTGASGTWVQIGNTEGNHYHRDRNSGLLPGTTYYYRVFAYNSAGNSSYSNEDSATTQGTPPPVLPAVTIVATDASAGEPADNGTFTVTRTGSTSASLTVNISRSGTATNGTDYTSIATTKVIPAGSASATISVSVINDTTVESTETVILTLVTSSGYTLGAPSSATVNITSDDGTPPPPPPPPVLPTVTLVVTDGVAGEPGDSGSFTLSRTGATTSPLSVNFTISGTATNGSDYSAISSPVVIPTGANFITVPINVIDDSLVESLESVSLTINTNANYTVGSQNSGTINISSEDVTPPSLPIITISTFDVNAGEPFNNGSISFTRTGTTTSPLTVNFTISGTATNGVDYNTILPSVVIPAGNTSALVDVFVIDDSLIESSELVTLTMSPSSTYQLSSPTASTVTITDNDGVPPPPPPPPPPGPQPKIPLTDMGVGTTYFGFSGGLYENSSNTIPLDHSSIGAAKQISIQPLDTNGNPNSNGKVVMLSLGVSNTSQEFYGQTDGVRGDCTAESFMSQAAGNSTVNKTSLSIANGAFSSQSADLWDSPTDANYNRVRDTILAPASLSENQVQIVWVKTTLLDPTVSLPSSQADAYALETALANVVRTLKVRYPNVKQVFLSSRIYAGYTTTTYSPEPYTYENGFSVKWLVQAQIDQMRNGGVVVDSRAGDLNYNSTAPWIAWGPYLWANGTTPRSDGMTWQVSDYVEDGVHPTCSGVSKVANMLMNFFLNSPLTSPWFKDLTAPAISNVNTSNVTQFTADISWNTNELSDSQVVFSAPCPPFGCTTPLNTALVSGHTVNLTNFPAATSYTYIVKSRDPAGNLATSGSFSFTTQTNGPTPPPPPPPGAPATPTALHATAPSSVQVNLDWVDNATNETGYKFERKIGVNSTYVEIGNTEGTTYHRDRFSGLVGGTTYYYRVKAYNAIGSSAYSNEISITTP